MKWNCYTVKWKSAIWGSLQYIRFDKKNLLELLTLSLWISRSLGTCSTTFESSYYHSWLLRTKRKRAWLHNKLVPCSFWKNSILIHRKVLVKTEMVLIVTDFCWLQVSLGEGPASKGIIDAEIASKKVISLKHAERTQELTGHRKDLSSLTVKTRCFYWETHFAWRSQAISHWSKVRKSI